PAGERPRPAGVRWRCLAVRAAPHRGLGGDEPEAVDWGPAVADAIAQRAGEHAAGRRHGPAGQPAGRDGALREQHAGPELVGGVAVLGVAPGRRGLVAIDAERDAAALTERAVGEVDGHLLELLRRRLPDPRPRERRRDGARVDALAGRPDREREALLVQ